MAYLTQVVTVAVANGAGSTAFELRGEATRFSFLPPNGATFSWATVDADGYTIDSGDSAPNSTRVFPTTAQYDGRATLSITGADVAGTYKAKIFAKHGNRDV